METPVIRIQRCVVVLPDRVIGPFQSEEGAKEYVSLMFDGDDELQHTDLTWSIKPVETP
ncbi:hypothetical protein [Bradyrhizobium japonicum]|uniref:hypothetical protein n=1 Tax=Bradyrhizobium japonicum TaxID=375 RepID=UPI001E39B1D6|nr:hypothetical protein [Bradyrhizobium japonicum]MCD9821173.1 hypothetical protein [Bradyrhizobium japonicum]MEB2674130.1 hypothetical protein [Bradyrhizobium japonicum]WRI93317.1 hypothetical protein R3F75_21230 [Bradyrhizobium japonicum]